MDQSLILGVIMPKNENKVYNLAVIGCGYWGPNLIRNFRALPNCRVTTVSDRDQARLNHMKTLYPDITITTDFMKILEDDTIDAVAIATPVFTHHPLAMKTLQAGKHTFIEKPLASSVAQCKDLIDVAKQNSLILMVGHTFVYTPAVRNIKEIIDSGEIGEVLYINSRRLNLGLFQKDINVAWDLAPHDLSIILYILGKTPTSVNCQGKAHINPQIEDITTIALNFSDENFAMIQSSWLDPRKIREITIVGSKKMIVYDDIEINEKIKIYDKNVQAPPHYDTFAEFQYSYHYGGMTAPFIKQTEPLKVECQHFIDCIASGKESDSSGEEGLKVVQILEAASESLRKNGAQITL